MHLFKNITVALVFLLFNNSLVAQNKDSSIVIYPHIPHAGDTITIIYNPSLSNLALTSDIKAYVTSYTLKGKGWVRAIDLKKIDSLQVCKLISKRDDLAFLIYPASATTLDYKYKSGYPIILFGDNGFPLPHAYASLAKHYFNEKKRAYAKEAENFFKMEFMLYPLNKKHYFADYILSCSELGQAKDGLLTELNEFCKQGNFSANEMSAISLAYEKLGDVESEKKYSQLALDADTTGVLAKKVKVKEFNTTREMKRRIEILDDFEKTYPNDDNLPTMYMTLSLFYAVQNNTIDLDIFLNKHPESNSSFINSNIAMILESHDIIKATEYAMRGYDMANKNLSSSVVKSIILFQNAALASNTMGYLLAKQKKYKEALVYFKEGDGCKYGLGVRSPKIFDQYIITLMQTNSPDAIKTCDSVFRIGQATEEIKSFLKSKKVGMKDNNDYKIYMDSIETVNTNQLKRAVENRIINKPAPEFTLKDISGRNASLSDYKGKIVVLDFWATWCAPCIASFPAMQKLMEVYKADKEVVFLMIDTEERVENRVEKVKAFMKKKDYKFNTLIDERDEVSKAYQIKAYPTKLVIDKLGNIRFTSRGYDNNEANLVSELSIMIEKIK